MRKLYCYGKKSINSSVKEKATGQCVACAVVCMVGK